MTDVHQSDGSAIDNDERETETTPGETSPGPREGYTIRRGATVLASAASTAAVVAAAWRAVRDEGRGWLGLKPRRSPLTIVTLVGAGATIGAGLALLLAPTSGKELRRLVLDKLGSEDEPRSAEAPTEGTRGASVVHDGVVTNGGAPA